jgi:hypothetical protein
MRYLITRYWQVSDPAAYDASGIQRVEFNDDGVRITFADGIPCDFWWGYQGAPDPEMFSEYGIRLGVRVVEAPAE